MFQLKIDEGEVYEVTRGNAANAKHEASDVLRMEIGGYHYVLLYSKHHIINLLTTKENGEVDTRTCNQHYHAGAKATPLKIHGETIEQVKCGWWTVYVVTSKCFTFLTIRFSKNIYSKK